MNEARRDYSREDMAWAVRLANQGADKERIARALARKPKPGIEYSMKYLRILDERGLEAADRYARTTAEKALRFVAENPKILDRCAGIERIVQIEEAANATPWAVWGPGSRRALEASFVVAHRVSNVNFGLSLREWASIAGQSFDWVRYHRNRLVRLGWLKRNAHDRPGRTSRYRLRIPATPHSTLYPTFNSQGLRYECGVPLAHDAFRDKALGDESWYLLFSLVAPMSPMELCRRTGFSSAALSELLEPCLEAGLIADDTGLLRRADDLVARLDQVAREKGTDGAGEVARVLFEAERIVFRASTNPAPQESKAVV